jgi:hypothetical protein
LALALLLAGAVHGGTVWFASSLPTVLWAGVHFGLTPSLSIEELPEVELEAGETGGGSALPGEAEVARGDAEETPDPAPQAVSEVRPERAPPPDVAVLPVPETAEPSGGMFEEEGEWFEQDVLLAYAAEEDAFAVRPRSAFQRIAGQASFVRPLTGEQPATNSGFRGARAGAHGGPGGMGLARRAPAFVTESFAFGGREGGFLGRMCFVEPTLRSLKSLGACQTQLQFRTDRIDIPPRPFDQGFPGIDRDEWFSILYTGTITATRAGNYAFRVLSDDGSVLHIDGRPVVDNDGLHGPSAVAGEVYLDEGPHRFELWYFQGPRMLIALQVFVTPPGQGERLLEPTL